MNSRVFGRRALWAILILSLIGFGLSVESYREYHKSTSGEATWCSFGEVSDCEKAFQSSYSKLWGRPISLYGAATYLLVGAIAAVGLASGGPFVLSSLFHLGLVSLFLLGGTGYFAWALFTQVKTLCVLCLGDYLVNLSIAGTIGWACLRVKPPCGSVIRWDIRSTLGSFRSAVRTAVLVVLLIALCLLVVRAERTYYIANKGLHKILRQDPIRLDTPWARNLPAKGLPDAPIEVILIGDYECPFCAATKREWDKFLETYPEMIRISSLAHPMNSDCNLSEPDNEYHPNACIAAYLALSVKEKSGLESYFAIHDQLYEHGHALTPDLISQLAKEFRITDEEFQEVRNRSLSPDGLKLDYQIAERIGLQSIPTTLLNGIHIRGYIEGWALLQVIKKELERKNLHLKDFKRK